MGIETLALIALTASIGTTAYSIDQNRRAANSQKDARNQQIAQNAAERMNAQRQQIREERVKRARILQSAENTGTTGSSGAEGAVGGLATQLDTNIGISLGRQQSADLISGFQQSASDAAMNAQNASAIGSLVSSAASVYGGIKAKAPDSIFDMSPVNTNGGR